MRRVARIVLMALSILNGFAGLVCGVMFLAKPDGSLLQAGGLLPVLKTLPLATVFFRDFFWIGVAMLLALGIPNTIAAVMLIRRIEGQYFATLLAGILLLLWCGFEFVYMFNAGAVGYFVVGATMVLASVMLMRPAAEPGA
jgi:hypothetical protein